MIDEPAAPADAPGTRGAMRWQIATAATAALGLVLAGTVFVVTNRQLDEQRERIDELERRLAAESDTSDTSSGPGLGDIVGDLFGDLFGGDALGDVDPRLVECLSPSGGFGANLGDGSIPDADLETQVAAITHIVEEERGLRAGDDLNIEFVSMDEVQRRAVEISEEHLDRDRATTDARTLSLLGAVEPGLDILEAELAALDAGVAGFYDPDTGDLVIGSESMDAVGAFITAHELVHALADAEFGLPDLERLAFREGGDAAYAALSAIEGDASLYSQRFVTDHLPFEQLLELDEGAVEALEALDVLPYFVVRSLEFPYVEGLTFSCDVFLYGGWEAVDETYRTPPETSAQVLFPDRYRAGEFAVDVTIPGGPPGWELLHSDTFGAADLLFLLEAPGGDEAAALSDPLERVAAWAGGRIRTWGDGESTAVALVLADRGGTTPLCDTVTEYYTAAFPTATQTGEAGPGGTFEGPGQAAIVHCRGAEVTLGIGPDVETARGAAG